MLYVCIYLWLSFMSINMCLLWMCSLCVFYIPVYVRAYYELLKYSGSSSAIVRGCEVNLPRTLFRIEFVNIFISVITASALCVQYSTKILRSKSGSGALTTIFHKHYAIGRRREFKCTTFHKKIAIEKRRRVCVFNISQTFCGRRRRRRCRYNTPQTFRDRKTAIGL